MLQAEETQILSGDGNAPNLRRMFDTAGIQTQALGADSRTDAIAKAITKCFTVGNQVADAICLHPTNWEAIRLEKDANGGYSHADPLAGDAFTLWGLPVLSSVAMTLGTALVGAFAGYAVVYDRQQATVEFARESGTNFATNAITFRGESRIGLAVTRPTGFVQVTGL